MTKPRFRRSERADPRAHDRLECRAIRGDLLAGAEGHDAAIARDPAHEAPRIGELRALLGVVLHLRALVEDELDAVLRAQEERREELVRAEARRIPLDVLADPRTHAEDDAAHELDVPPQRVVELAQELAD